MRFVFAFLFFIIRILYGNYLTVQLLHAYVLKPASIEWNCCAPWKYWCIVGLNLAMHCLNLHWFRLIFSAIIREESTLVDNETREPLEFSKQKEVQLGLHDIQSKRPILNKTH